MAGLVRVAGCSVLFVGLASASLGGLRGEDDGAAGQVDTFPDETTGFDIPGPYTLVPSQEQETNPAEVRDGWDNESSLTAQGSFNSWGQSFCTAHGVGTFCDQQTQVRCCKKTWGTVKCGSTLLSSRCGSSGSGSVGLKSSIWPSWPSWHVHPGWHQSSFCTTHHTGFFCFQHSTVHCCNDYGHFVDCSTRSGWSRRC